MKIGLSYSRCIKDILEEKVNIDDVLIIIARTDFDPNIDDEWRPIWFGYTTGGGRTAPEWYEYADDKEYEDKFRSISIQLYNDGKIHQPRKFGAYPRRLPYYWLETILPDHELERNPMVKSVWEKFKTVAGLTNTKLDNHNDD